MQRTSIFRAGDCPPWASRRTVHRRILACVAAAAMAPIMLGCASASRWTEAGWSAAWWSDEPADAAVLATDDPADTAAEIPEAAEDPELTEAFARLEQAQLDMRQRQTQAAAAIAQGNRAASPNTGSSATEKSETTVR